MRRAQQLAEQLHEEGRAAAQRARLRRLARKSLKQHARASASCSRRLPAVRPVCPPPRGVSEEPAVFVTRLVAWRPLGFGDLQLQPREAATRIRERCTAACTCEFQRPRRGWEQRLAVDARARLQTAVLIAIHAFAITMWTARRSSSSVIAETPMLPPRTQSRDDQANAALLHRPMLLISADPSDFRHSKLSGIDS